MCVHCHCTWGMHAMQGDKFKSISIHKFIMYFCQQEIFPTDRWRSVSFGWGKEKSECMRVMFCAWCADRLAGQISSGSGSEGQHWEIWSGCPQTPPSPHMAGAGALVSALRAGTGSLGRRETPGPVSSPVSESHLTPGSEKTCVHETVLICTLHFTVCFC